MSYEMRVSCACDCECALHSAHLDVIFATFVYVVCRYIVICIAKWYCKCMRVCMCIEKGGCIVEFRGLREVHPSRFLLLP